MDKNRIEKILEILKKGKASTADIKSKIGGSPRLVKNDLDLLEGILIQKEKSGNRNETEYSLKQCKTPQEKQEIEYGSALVDTINSWEKAIDFSEQKFSAISNEIRLYSKISIEHNEAIDHLIETQIIALTFQNMDAQSIMFQRKVFPLIIKELRKQVFARNELIQKFYDLVNSFDKSHKQRIMQYIIDYIYLQDKRAGDALANAESEYMIWRNKNDPKRLRV